MAENAFELYCDRINAVAEVGGKAKVYEEDYKYHLIRVSSDGSVTAPPGLEPTPEELAAIQEQLLEILRGKQAVFPVPPSGGLPDMSEGTWYEFRDAKNQLLALTQRIEAHEGKPKRIKPWAYYDGEGWVRRRPSQPFPLYGEWQGRTRVMIHEGEKAAQAAIDISTSDPSAEGAHPWVHGLREFGHVAWTGGGSSVWNTDWSVLEGKEIWILADNDAPGREAAHRVASLVKGSSVYILDHWNYPVPSTWDIADDPPAEVTWEEFLCQFSLAESATYSYEDESGKIRHGVKSEFLRKFAYCTQTQEFLELRRPYNRHGLAGFNNAYSHLSAIRQLGQAMLANRLLPRVDLPGYHPGKAPGEFFVEKGMGAEFVNIFQPSSVRPRRGSIRPLLAFARHLIPSPIERKIFLRWCALMVGVPGTRMTRWGVLMISKRQGVGKSTVADLIRHLLGAQNVTTVSAKNIVETHNGWAEHTRLLVIEELMEGKPFQTYEALKPYVTNDTIAIRRMYQDSYDIGNRMAVLASSNHRSSLSLPEDDRRWFIPEMAESPPSETDLCLLRYLAGGQHLFLALRKWFLHEGDQYCLHAAQEYGSKLVERGYDASKGVTDAAPMTGSKEDMIYRSQAEWFNRIESVISELPNDALISAADLTYWLAEQGENMVRSTTVADKIEELGWRRQFAEPGASKKERRIGRVTIKKGKGQVTLYSRAEHPLKYRNYRAIVWFSREMYGRYDGVGVPFDDWKIRQGKDSGSETVQEEDVGGVAAF